MDAAAEFAGADDVAANPLPNLKDVEFIEKKARDNFAGVMKRVPSGDIL
ncbi:MAG: hypothetical protein ACKON9_24790 [Planctomycetaceae bacterium]